MNVDDQQVIQASTDAITPFSTDISSLLSAYSFISPFSGLTDPKADILFDSVSTAYCNGADLVLPFPREKPAHVPFWAKLWTQTSVVKEVPGLELSDEDFDQYAERCTEPLVQYVEGDPSVVANWLAFQFTDEVAEAHLTGSNTDTFLRAGPLASELAKDQRLSGLLDRLDWLRREGRLEIPRDYEKLIIPTALPSLRHLYLAYLHSVALRGPSYALAIGRNPQEPPYREHWIRTPTVRAQFEPGLKVTQDLPTTWFPWGTILTVIFDPLSPLISRAPSRVAEVLAGIREHAPHVRQAFLEMQASDSTPSRLTDAEAMILDVLGSVGIYPRIKTPTVAVKVVAWVRALVDKKGPISEVPVYMFTRATPKRLARKAVVNFTRRFRRDAFWDLLEDPGIRLANKIWKRQIANDLR